MAPAGREFLKLSHLKNRVRLEVSMPHKTYEAVIDQFENVVLTQPIDCAPSSRPLVIVLDGEPASRNQHTRSTSTTDDVKPEGEVTATEHSLRYGRAATSLCAISLTEWRE